jgi:hypothetical protein
MTTLLTILGLLFSCLCVVSWLAPLAYLMIEIQQRTDEAYRAFIRKWASENGYEIARCDRRWFASPWMFSASGAQGIYHVTVVYQEENARQRRAWVRCGGWLLGPKTEKVEMHWDGVSQALPPRTTAELPLRPQDDPLWDEAIDG